MPQIIQCLSVNEKMTLYEKLDYQKMNGLPSIDGNVIQLYLSCSAKIVVIFKGGVEV